MAPKLYQVLTNPPSRAVQMTAKAIGLELELIPFKELDVSNLEKCYPEFINLNSQQTLPTLVDEDGFVIWESHAIMPYLLSKYAKDDSLYPKDIKKRAIIDQRLHFESGFFYPRCLETFRPLMRKLKTTIDQKDIDLIHEGYGFLEAFLDGNRWVAGDSVSIADFSLISSVSSANIFIPAEPAKYPNISAWLKRAEALPAYEANVKGLRIFTDFIKPIIN